MQVQVALIASDCASRCRLPSLLWLIALLNVAWALRRSPLLSVWTLISSMPSTVAVMAHKSLRGAVAVVPITIIAVVPVVHVTILVAARLGRRCSVLVPC
jgi:hypothetical protein